MSESCRTCFRLRIALPHDHTDRNHYWCVVQKANGDYESRFLGHIGETDSEQRIDEQKCKIWRPRS